MLIVTFRSCVNEAEIYIQDIFLIMEVSLVVNTAYNTKHCAEKIIYNCVRELMRLELYQVTGYFNGDCVGFLISPNKVEGNALQQHKTPFFKMFKYSPLIFTLDFI